MAERNKQNIIRDALWKDIVISDDDDFVKNLIDEPIIQRLRRIRMNDFAHLSFPGMTASRFEHAIGVYHLLSRQSDEDIFGELMTEAEERVALTKQHTGLLRKILYAAAIYHHCTFPPYSYAIKPVTDLVLRKSDEQRLYNTVAEMIYTRHLSPYFEDVKTSFMPLFINESDIKHAIKSLIARKNICGRFNKEIFDKLYQAIFSIPRGANFLEAVRRDLFHSGIGASFRWEIVIRLKLKKEGGDSAQEPFVTENCESLLHNLSSLFDLVYTDITNTAAAAFLQKLLVLTSQDTPFQIFLTPLKEFLEDIDRLREVADFDTLENLLLKLDDYRLYTALKKCLISASIDSSIAGRILTKVLELILYGRRSRDLKKKTLTGLEKMGYVLTSHSLPVASLSYDSEPIMDEFPFTQKLGKVAELLFVAVCPVKRLMHYLNELQEINIKVVNNSEGNEALQNLHTEIKHLCDTIKRKHTYGYVVFYFAEDSAAENGEGQGEPNDEAS